MQDDSGVGELTEEEPSLFFPMPDPSRTREERLEARLAQLSKISTALIGASNAEWTTIRRTPIRCSRWPSR